MATYSDDLNTFGTSTYASVVLTETWRGAEVLPALGANASVAIDEDLRTAPALPNLVGVASVTITYTVAPSADLSLLAAASITLTDTVTGDVVELLAAASVTIEGEVPGDNLELLAIASVTLEAGFSQAFLQPYLGICSPPFTPPPCAQSCPPTPEGVMVAALLAPLLERRARRRPAVGAIATEPGLLALPPVPTCGPAFTPVQCAPQWPADPPPFLPPPVVTTCHAPLGLFVLGSTCLGSDAPVQGVDDLMLLAVASISPEGQPPAEEDLVLLASASIEVS